MSKIIEGEPLRVEGRELVPIVRVTTRGRRRAVVGTHRLAGQGWGLVRLRPIAILERSEAGVRRYPIPDNTARALSRLFLVALVIPLLLGLVVWVTGRGRGERGRRWKMDDGRRKRKEREG
jgi:hypothetical protein